jgi:hypothetical protein
VLVDLLVVSLATAYGITALERFVDLTFLRGFIALGFSAAGVFVFDYRDGPALILAMGGAFLALMYLAVTEAVISRETIVADLRRKTRL